MRSKSEALHELKIAQAKVEEINREIDRIEKFESQVKYFILEYPTSENALYGLEYMNYLRGRNWADSALEQYKKTAQAFDTMDEAMNRVRSLSGRNWNFAILKVYRTGNIEIVKTVKGN